jgi:hypothetical protein
MLQAGFLDVADSLSAMPTEPLECLVDAFGLSAFERDLVVLVGLPEEHEIFGHGAALLHPRGESRISFAAVASVLGLDAVGRRHLRRAIDVGPLHRHSILLREGTNPVPQLSFRLAEGLWSALWGNDHWPRDCRPLSIGALTSDELPAERFEGALTQEPRVVLVSATSARPATEVAAIVASTLARTSRAAVFFDAKTVEGDGAPLASIHTAVRGACPVVVGCTEGAPLPDHPGAVIACVTDGARLRLDDRPVVSFELGDRKLGDSIRMWENLAPELNGGAEHLASVLRVDQLWAARAVNDARAAAHADASMLTLDGIVGRVRRRTDTDLPSSVNLVHPTASWDALVTTDDIDSLLRSVVDRVHGQVRVLHEWGFGARGARGVRVLFSGPPGTGKTLSAEIMASSLGLDLLVVDLSALVSKWLGETEKNISEVFDAAERCQAVLFFDEADAIFGRRTDGSDAQSRWANLETAHLLSRIDAFHGLVVLATNLRGNIDDAFVRRLDVIVEFDEPGPQERQRLWATHLPEDAPLAADVDLDQLATVYAITGGLIRNSVLAAAFRAAAEDDPIGQQMLLEAVEQEYQKAGRSFPGMPRGAGPTDRSESAVSPIGGI